VGPFREVQRSEGEAMSSKVHHPAAPDYQDARARDRGYEPGSDDRGLTVLEMWAVRDGESLLDHLVRQGGGRRGQQLMSNAAHGKRPHGKTG
jgi:hypothetical protein